ncbi:hypothetical protein D3C80_1473290 [compost metagenome]
MYGPPPRYHFPYWLRQIASILVVGTMILALVGFFIGESVNPTFVGIVVALQIIVQANRTEAGQRDLVIKMLAFTALVPVLMGAGYGQDDRHNHRQNNGALLKCDAHPVYRPIGGMLLGRLGKSHVLLNEECKPVLTIPDIQPKVPREKVEAVQADLRSHVAALFRFPANRPAPQSPPSARLPSPG